MEPDINLVVNTKQKIYEKKFIYGFIMLQQISYATFYPLFQFHIFRVLNYNQLCRHRNLHYRYNFTFITNSFRKKRELLFYYNNFVIIIFYYNYFELEQ